MIARDELHTLLDAIPGERLADARAALADLAGPVWLALTTAPEDDEPVTDEDVQAMAEGEEDARLGRTISLDEFVRRYRATP